MFFMLGSFLVYKREGIIEKLWLPSVTLPSPSRISRISQEGICGNLQ